jgi:hypothetical protein
MFYNIKISLYKKNGSVARYFRVNVRPFTAPIAAFIKYRTAISRPFKKYLQIGALSFVVCPVGRNKNNYVYSCDHHNLYMF